MKVRREEIAKNIALGKSTIKTLGFFSKEQTVSDVIEFYEDFIEKMEREAKLYDQYFN